MEFCPEPLRTALQAFRGDVRGAAERSVELRQGGVRAARAGGARLGVRGLLVPEPRADRAVLGHLRPGGGAGGGALQGRAGAHGDDDRA
eukprot:1776539-Rhodomonas_salina.1